MQLNIQSWPQGADLCLFQNQNCLRNPNLVSKQSITDKSIPGVLILASTNPQYDKILSIELPVQHMKIPSSEHGENTGRTCYVHKLVFVATSALSLVCNSDILWFLGLEKEDDSRSCLANLSYLKLKKTTLKVFYNYWAFKRFIIYNFLVFPYFRRQFKLQPIWSDNFGVNSCLSDVQKWINLCM